MMQLPLEFPCFWFVFHDKNLKCLISNERINFMLKPFPNWIMVFSAKIIIIIKRKGREGDSKIEKSIMDWGKASTDFHNKKKHYEINKNEQKKNKIKLRVWIYVKCPIVCSIIFNYWFDIFFLTVYRNLCLLFFFISRTIDFIWLF